MMQANPGVPQGMQALIAAQQALQQTSQPVTPSGQPTIAGQAQQALQQKLQGPPPAPQGGLPGMMPSDPFRRQLMKTRQMQAQQQMAQQPPPQQPPQEGMASGGIARLRADNMARIGHYARGGILKFTPGGFADLTPQQLSEKLAEATAAAQSAAQRQDAQAALEAGELVNRLREELGKKAGQTVASPEPKAGREARQFYKPGQEDPLLSGVRPTYRRGPDGRSIPLTQEEQAQAVSARQRTARSTEIPQTAAEAEMFAGINQIPQGPMMAIPNVQIAGQVPPQASPQAPPQAAPGIAGIRRPDIGKRVTPDLKAAMTEAEGMFGDATSGISAIDRLNEEIYNARLAQAPTRQAELEALRKAQTEREALRAKTAEETPFMRMMAVASEMGRSGLGGAGRGYMGFEDLVRARKAAEISEDEAQATKIGAIIEAQNNQKLNAMVDKAGRMSESLKSKVDISKAAATMAGTIYNTQGHISANQISALASIYATDVGAETQRLLRATQQEANQLAKAESLLRSYLHDSANVEKDIEAQLQKKFGPITMMFNNPELMKKPENIAIYNNYLKEKTDMIESRLTPIKQNIARVQSNLEGGGGYGAPPPGAVKPKG